MADAPDIGQEFQSFLAQQDNVTSVIDDDGRFRAIINIGEDAYQSIRIAKVTGKMLAIGAAGAAGGLAASTAHFAALGLWGKALVLVGLGTHPVGWIILGGGAAAALVYGGWTAYEKLHASAFEPSVPKFLRHGVDVLGDVLAHLVVPFGLYIARADGAISDPEVAAMRRIFVEQWGYNGAYMDGVIAFHVQQSSKFKIARAAEALHKACSNYKASLDNTKLMPAVVSLAEQIAQADGTLDPKERAALRRLVKALSRVQASTMTVKSWWPL